MGTTELSYALKARRFVGSLLPQRARTAIVSVPAYLHVARYSAPNPVRPSVRISEEADGWLKQMREAGCVRIENDETRAVADFAERQYFQKLEQSDSHDLDGSALGDPRLFTHSYNIDYFRQYGTQIGVYVSFKEEGFAPVLRNPDIAAMIYNYYRRQPYYRNQPVLEFIDIKLGTPVPHGDEYHVDRFHQISGMLLVTDQTESDTHMEYVPKSHRRSLLRTGVMLTQEESDRWAERSKHELIHLTGKKGTLYIFDTTGIHARRLIPGSKRKIFHMTWTTGHHIVPFNETGANWPELQSSPAHVRGMFSKLN